MDIKSALRKGAELGVVFAALTTLILVGCGGGGGASGGGTTTGAATTSTITPYKGPFAPGATVTITDANGNPVTLLTGGTVGANGIISVTYSPNVVYPLLVSVTGTYYNEVTGLSESTTVPLRSLITDATAATNVPVTIVTETAVALLLNQTGGISATNPMQAASAVAALGTAGTIFGIPASTVPSFTGNTTSDPNTILLSALAVVANSQAGANLAAKVVALANSLATNPASAPSVITTGALNSAIGAMTSGASSVAASGVTAPSAPTISAPPVSQDFNAIIAAGNSIVGTWNSGDTLNTSVVTLFGDGTYMQAKAATTNAGATPGIEYGTYTWNSITGAFTPTCPALVDTNGSDGFCNGSTAAPATITVSGNTMNFNGGVSGTLNRVIGNPLVGSWYNVTSNGVSPSFGTPETVVITLFANGDYVMAQSVVDPTNPSCCQPGLEHGTYTWDPATGAFAAMCPTVDTNGQAGFSAPIPGVQCVQGSKANFGTMTVSGNVMTYTDNAQHTFSFERLYSTTQSSVPFAAGSLAASRRSVIKLLYDEQVGFTGSWGFKAATGAAVSTVGQSIGAAIAGALGEADAKEKSVTFTSQDHYTQSYAEQRMIPASASWSAATLSATYALPPTGSWVANPNAATIVDNHDGTIMWTPTGLTADVVTVTRSGLGGTAIVCKDALNSLTPIACAAPGNYSAGSYSYTLSNVPTADEFKLYGTLGSTQPAVAVLPVTDATGTALTTLPSPTTTLCAPNWLLVFQVISPPPLSGDNVNVFSTASCSSADISTATLTPAVPLGTVFVSVQPTPNSTVPNVIRVQATVTATAYLNNSILGLRAGAVYPGYMNPVGVAYTSSESNKTAVNAKLVANGLTPIP